MSARLIRGLGAGVGVGGALAVALVPSSLHDPATGSRPAFAAAVALVMAAFWLFEVGSMAVVALLPLVAYPLLGILPGGPGKALLGTASAYVDGYIFLFLGGMTLGAAMEEHGLHRRLALHVMRAIGRSPPRLLLGMLVATAAVSMWISNTATAVMMLPIAIALVGQLEESAGRKLPGFACAVMLSVAYGANVGGIGTKIGTGTNSIFCGFISRRLGIDLGFVTYLGIGLPFVIVFVPIVWGVLWRVARRDRLEDGDRSGLDEAIGALGPVSRRERIVATIFLVCATLWVAGDLLRPLLEPPVLRVFGARLLPKHYEATVALGGAAALLASRTLGLRGLRRLPYGTLVLLGGSFALASGIESSGLSALFARSLAGLAAMPFVLQVALASAATVALSAIASNTATVNVMLSVLPPSPALLATTSVAASCDFMLPAGTPPNAIVFGSGRVSLPTMIRTGFVLDVLAILLCTLEGWLLLPHVLPGP